MNKMYEEKNKEKFKVLREEVDVLEVSEVVNG
jgi:hypothetical protein